MLSKSFVFLFLTTAAAHLSICQVAKTETPSLHPVANTCSTGPWPYIVKNSTGRGLGAFATHSLEVGTVILRERPIIKISRPDYAKGKGYPISEVTKVVRKEFQLLPPEEKEEVVSLTYHALPGEVQSLGYDILGLIFRTNAYNTGTGFGLFPKIARINHSCQPNAAYYWSEKLGKRIIYATQPIREGEEIFVSYIPLTMSQVERQQRLNRYGFTCKCSACSQTTISASDKRRTDINSAFAAFEPQLTLDIPRTPTALRKARKNAASSLELAELVEEERLADYYAIAYRIVAISHARVKDWEVASVWANKAYERRVIEDAESMHTLEMYELTSRFIESWKSDLQR